MENAEDRETVQGGLEVEVLLKLGSDHLILLFTQNRLLLAHIAKVGRAGPAFSMFGKMPGGLRRMHGKASILQKLALTDPERILGLDPDNFSIAYPEIVSMIIEPGGGERSKITLVTNDQKIELYASRIALDGLKESVQSLLRDKIQYKQWNRVV